MLCAISGEAPQVPVASRKSGNVFEKRLIETYIAENGRDPVTGEELSTEDLVDLKTSRTVKPRPPTLTSIPSLLSVFQNEWDALALESYTLKQHLSQLRQELSTALYNNDAAVRVIARLTKERDEARDALGKLSVGERRSAATTNGDAMQVDGASLPGDVAAKVDATQERLSKTRRKRPVPDGWVTAEELQDKNLRVTTKPVVAQGSKCLAVSANRDVAVVGGLDGRASLYSVESGEALQPLESGNGAINDALFVELGGNVSPMLAKSTGEVQLFSNNKVSATFNSHAGSANALSLHPCGEILLSVGSDKSFVLYDLVAGKPLSQMYTNTDLHCCQFHPDGHIFATGGANGQIKVFETKTGENAANFDASGPVQALSFSENGTWLASISSGSTSVSVWNLRTASELKSIDFGAQLESIQFDYTGQYLAAAGAGFIAVQQYDKGSKSWSEPLRKAVAATAVQWGPLGQKMLVLGSDGALSLLE